MVKSMKLHIILKFTVCADITNMMRVSLASVGARVL